jgi:2-polyprenyl-3-methyl-5-hydroxy-6-metoxy-1,4-benzoquinol methylase
MTTQRTADWDDLWLKYHSINEKKVQSYLRIFNFFGVPTTARILDVGCGSGETLKVLKRHGFTKLTGIEPESRLFEHNNSDNMIMQGNCLDMSSVNDQYDVLLMFGVLHHLHTFEEMQQTLQNIKQKLVPGGAFYSVEQWKNLIRTVAMKLVRDTPVGKLHSTLRIERELLKLERKELDHWLEVERKVTTYAQEIGLQVVFYRKDLRYRYIIFKKAHSIASTVIQQNNPGFSDWTLAI